MFKNYLKTALRNLWKNKFYSSLNIMGLAIGLAVGIMILMWVIDEFSYDRFHRNSKNIYTVISNLPSGDNKQSFDYVPGSIAPYSLREVPGVQKAVRVTPNSDFRLLGYGEKEFVEKKMAYADPSIFTVFDFKLLKGNIKDPFPNNNAVIISSSTAKKYFGNEDPIGKILQADKKQNFTVQGVMKDFPENSSVKFDILFPFDILIKRFVPNDAWKSLENDWGNYNYMTFLLVSPNADINAIETKLTQLQRKHNQFDKGSTYSLQPLEKKHLYAADGSSSALQMVNIFLVIAVLLLLIAGINYVNLSTARSMLRSKEVSIRKIVGANRVQLFFQFIYETAILFIISSVVAIGIIYVSMPLYNELSGKNMQFSLADMNVWAIIGIVILTTLALSSIYPALLLSSFKPLQALKGKLSFGVGNSAFRKILVTSQFVFSIGLIISTIIIGRQMNYIREKEIGYDKTNVFAFEAGNMQTHYDAVKAELLRQPGILGVTGANELIVNASSITGDTDWDGKKPNQMFMIHPIGVDKDFLSFFKIPLVEGTGYTGAKSDSTKFILNETAVRDAGIKDPIGKRFKLWGTEGTIAGVVKDFHFLSLKQKIEPAIFYYSLTNPAFYVKTTGRDAAKAIAVSKNFWSKYNAGFPFEYNFLDETYDRMYKSDQQAGVLFRGFAAIAIIISCLGLLGLATYTAQTRIKEIGIRKVLGASTLNIFNMLNKDFIKLVFIALVIASPVAWLYMNKWLQDFEYRIDIGWWIFILAGVVALLIALLTVSYQAIKAAISNPVKNLRTE